MKANDIKRYIRKNLFSIILTAIVMLVLISWFSNTILQIINLTKVKSELNTQIAEQAEIGETLDERVAQIGSQSYVEKIAREYLKLYYPDEQLVIPVEATVPEPTEATVPEPAEAPAPEQAEVATE